MKFNVLQRSYKVFLGLLLLFTLTLATVENASSQLNYPRVPVLSLTGQDNGWKTDWYPDGRIWLPASADGDAQREFLLPVFIDNGWVYNPDRTLYEPEPIYSFQFTVQYDNSAVRAIGVQKFHPGDDPYYTDQDPRFKVNGEYQEPTAKEFNISWYDEKDPTYTEKLWENRDPAASTRQRGRAITIVGTSVRPLPTNQNPSARQWDILLYIRFRVIPYPRTVGTGSNTQILIRDDVIKFNDLNVHTTAPFTELRAEHPEVAAEFPDPPSYKFDNNVGLAGVDNQNTPMWATERTKPGVIYLKITTELPKFEFTCNRADGSLMPPPDPTLGPNPIIMVSPEFWKLRDPITLDSGSNQPFIGDRTITIANGQPLTRMMDIYMETDQPWLRAKFDIPGTNKYYTRQIDRKGYIYYLDNGILGPQNLLDPLGNFTQADPIAFVQIRCEPNLLQPAKNEMTGIYIGHITFKSPTALVSPVRVRVVFIYFRKPYEPDLYEANGAHRGMNIFVKNNKGEQVNLIFGVGHRATMGIDTLFGEYAYNYDLRQGQLDARWFPPDDATDEVKNAVPYGFGDWCPTDLPDGKRSNSRDIRDLYDSLTSITYYCRFNPNDGYPIVVEWDINDFPKDATLYLRDTVNGSHFSVDMRRATPLGQGKFAYTIDDARWKSFVIEYTLPRVIKYVDQYGNPIIKKGWNLLSLPVRPTDSKWDVFYPNAINKPYYFSQNQYQDETYLRPGIGYFIKYSDTVDKQFKGTFISKISQPTGDPVRLYPGWNTIGACSAPLNIQNIQFTNFGNEWPELDYSLKHGIWGYVTDRGYKEVSELVPGLGYWIKANYSGYLLIEVPKPKKNRLGGIPDNSFKDFILSQSAVLSIKDNSLKETELYLINDKDADVTYFELPPTPPNEVFDVRFDNNGILTNSNTPVINLQGVQYPISISVNKADANYTFVDAVTGKVFGTISQGNSGNVEIKESRSNAIRILKSDDLIAGFGLTNYPNPVSTFSTIKYTLQENNFVSIKLYDVLGNEVATLLNEFRTAGVYTLTFNASPYAAGAYICKLVSGNNSVIYTINVVK